MDSPARRRWTLFVVVVLAVMGHVEAVTHPGDIQALKEVKQALNASSIIKSTCMGSWDFTYDPCDAASSAHFTCGIDCSAPVLGVSRITGIRLEPGAGYSGPLSPAISNLTALQRLVVSGNAFHGPIPAALGALKDMFQLDLSMNNFTGPLPASLGLLSHLGYLSVRFNSLEGPIPEALFRLRNLTRLYLSENRFTGELPSPEAMLSLSIFDAGGNNLSGGVPRLFPPSLSSLSLRQNALTGPLPATLQNLTGLQVLDARQNRLNGTVGAFLYVMPSLQQLNLSHNQFTVIDAMNATNATSELLSMDLSFNRIGGALPESLAEMPKLTVLALRSNVFTGPIPYSYALKAATPLAGTLPLAQLYLEDNYLSGGIPSPLLNISADDVTLNLARNCLDSCPPHLFFCQGAAQKSLAECTPPIVVLPGR